jgi:hypothetical protein
VTNNEQTPASVVGTTAVANELSKKPPKRRALKIVGGLILGLAIMYVIAQSGSSESYAPMKHVDFGQAGPLTYEQMARTPEKYKGDEVCLTGQAIDVHDDYMRINITNKGNRSFDWWDDDVVSSYRQQPDQPRILEHDRVEFCGVFRGLYTYETILHAKRTIPRVDISVIKTTGKTR